MNIKKIGIFKKTAIYSALIASALITLLSMVANSAIDSSTAMLKKSISDVETGKISAMAADLERYIRHNRVNSLKELSKAVERIPDRNEEMLNIAIFSKTGDDNFFELIDEFPLNDSFKTEAEKKRKLQQNSETNFLKKAVSGFEIDPLEKSSNGHIWKNGYFPCELKNRKLVIMIMASVESTRRQLESHMEAVSFSKKIIIASAAGFGIFFIIMIFIFINHFSMLVEKLSESLKKAATGHTGLSMNPQADSDLLDLASSFNTLVDELRESKEKGEKPAMPDFFAEGVKLLKEENFDDSVALLRAHLFIRPDSFAAYFNIGVAYARLRKYDKSLAMFQKSLEINPSHELSRKYIDKINSLTASNA